MTKEGVISAGKFFNLFDSEYFKNVFMITHEKAEISKFAGLNLKCQPSLIKIDQK